MCSAKLLHNPSEEDGAGQTFNTVLDLIRSAREKIAIHMYVWRSDAIGNRIGEALLKAAERGVKISIIKDLSGMMYERIEMNRKSYLPREPGKKTKLWWRLIRPTFPDTFEEDEFQNGAGHNLIVHPEVNLTWTENAHTHTKYYLFDDHDLVTGSINIEERHRGYFDYMVHLTADNLGKHFQARESGESDPDPERKIEFFFNQTMHGQKRFEIKPMLLNMLNEAKEEIYIEVAYIGDPAVNSAIITAANRGVDVTLLLSEKANIGNDNNYRSAQSLLKSAPVKIFLTPRMIHSKMIASDRKTVFSGSANTSIFSMCKSAELNLLIKDPGLVADFLAVADSRKAISNQVQSPEALKNFNKPLALLQELHQKLDL
ncbi:MAG: phosphatidylserine/phosphatidylglycerophosphate/cardiolipin synthase family protein [Verrucomicrobiaceae bacterium]|nr:phosphatidylserine/phosphatidylglycerophosphate/cardiolipin synthase family protein [Verrucomicrobiaceae bacterium]